MSGAFNKTWQEELLNRKLRNEQESLKNSKLSIEYVKKKLLYITGWLNYAQFTKRVKSKVATIRPSTVRTNRKKLASIGIQK